MQGKNMLQAVSKRVPKGFILEPNEVEWCNMPQHNDIKCAGYVASVFQQRASTARPPVLEKGNNRHHTMEVPGLPLSFLRR